MNLFKQSTAASRIVGPILDSAGVEYASAVIGDLSISKNGGTLTALAAAATLTYIANGMYTLALTTGNTDTAGAVQVTCNKSTYQMPPHIGTVLVATVFDAIVTNATTAAGGLGDVQRMGGITVTHDSMADALLKRNVSNVEATAGEHTLTTIVLAMLQSNTTATPGSLTIYRTDGITVHNVRPLTSDAAAEPITGIS